MSDSIIVRVTLDAYDMASNGRQTQVYVQIPDVARASWLLPDSVFHPLKDRAWPEVLDVAHDHITYGGVASNSQSTAAWRAVREWLRDETNRDELQVAFEEHEARRHPVARKLLAEVEHLRKEGDAFRDQRNDVFATNERLHVEVQESDRARLLAENETRTLRREADALRARVDEVERAYTFDTAELKQRIAELEAERHSTNEALSDAAEALRENQHRIAELERPAVERHRREVRESYQWLAAHAGEDGDFEGEAAVRRQLAEREAVWAREDELAAEFAADPLAVKPWVPGPSAEESADRLTRFLAPVQQALREDEPATGGAK
ncbi:hypothetical protein ACWEPZ_37660 [Streptomyces sp. NPDC004288]|uniref:hypothetical protein n=1 Tax=Streptomyces sp. NPDC005574 TaxID=3156891 RepID=UPI0033B55625